MALLHCANSSLVVKLVARGCKIMIIDLDLKGRQVVVVGAGKEALGKIDDLVAENCQVMVVADRVSDAIQRLHVDKRIDLRVTRVEDGEFLKEFDSLILVMAITDDIQINRAIVAKARELGCLAYSADDTSFSDFAYPATINLYDTIKIAISTGGKSPLMARKIKESAEPVLKQCVKAEDALQVQLQGRIRESARQRLATPEMRKSYLYGIYADDDIRQLLSLGKLDEAEARARKILEQFK